MFGPIRQLKPRICPHERIEQCPLYVYSHDASGRGCAGGGDLPAECDVTLGKMDYHRAVARLQRGDA